MTQENEEDGVSLSEIARHVAAELRKLKTAQPKPDEAVMAFSECSIELLVEAKVSVGGGIKFWIFNFEAETESRQSHKITLKFAAAGDKIQTLMPNVNSVDPG